MTGTFFLDWATMAVSLFNTILFLWLGLTVVLNAESRSGGVWLAGGGLLLDGFFFVSHSAILAQGLDALGASITLWWNLGWIPVILSPLAWYLVMLWYAGYWDERPSDLYRRHRPWLWLTSLTAVILLGLLLSVPPLASLRQIANLDFVVTPAFAGVPILVVIYPIYGLACIGLWTHALQRPAQSSRAWQNMARRRSRPWLLAASAVVFAVILLVGWVMAWLVLSGNASSSRASPHLAATIAWFDLVIESLIAIAVIFLGRAVVSYEVFTGNILPRGGFLRYWLNVVILAAGYGFVVGWSLALHQRAIYAVLLTTLISAVFYALSSWRAYTRHQHFIERLRPFVASQGLVEQLLTPSAADVDIETPFQVLCRDVLGTRQAYLAATGPLAPLVSAPLLFPSHLSLSAPPNLSTLNASLTSPQTLALPLDPGECGGFEWLAPLWSERGLSGVLLLGEKEDGGLFTEEEIEIARASGERFIDILASAEMARRLMAVQRQRLFQSQVLDQRARRVLHDEVLPQLHTALLALTQLHAGHDLQIRLADQISGVHRQISDLLRDMPAALAPEVARLGLLDALRQSAEVEFGGVFDAIFWQVTPAAEANAPTLAPFAAEVLFFAAREAIRNAACHGRGGDNGRALHLRVEIGWQQGLRIVIEDDGVGLEGREQPGGHGLALHSTMMAVAGGVLEINSERDTFTRVTLLLPA